MYWDPGELDSKLRQAQKARVFPAAFVAQAASAPLLGAFLDNRFVMAEEPAVRENRLRLMRVISGQCSRGAHFNLLT